MSAVQSSKIPYSIVELQVEKFYAEGLQKNETLDEFLTKVESFIEFCGWDVDEYDARFQFGELD
jgi:hypothetical protein